MEDQERNVAPNEYGISDAQYDKCNHRIKSKNTSIVILPNQRTFVSPEHFYGICKYCGKPFHYIYEDGELKAYKDKGVTGDVDN